MNEADVRVLTLRELDALATRQRYGERRKDERVALLASTIANFSMALDRKKFPQGISPAAFLGEPTGKGMVGKRDVDTSSQFQAFKAQAARAGMLVDGRVGKPERQPR